MVVHDKVYDCTSFVDEHPYVSSLSYSIRLPPLNETLFQRDPRT
jgi:hypothetical protein